MQVWLKLPFSVPLHQLHGIADVIAGKFHGKSSPENADDLAALQQGQVQRNFRDVASSKADDEVAPVPAHRPQRSFGVISANGVVDDVGPIFTGQFFDASL